MARRDNILMLLTTYHTVIYILHTCHSVNNAHRSFKL